MTHDDDQKHNEQTLIKQERGSYRTEKQRGSHRTENAIQKLANNWKIPVKLINVIGAIETKLVPHDKSGNGR